MKTMEEYAKQYAKENRGKGLVTNVTGYCFTFEVYPKKETDKPVSYVVMKSWFLELQLLGYPSGDGAGLINLLRGVRLPCLALETLIEFPHFFDFIKNL